MLLSFTLYLVTVIQSWQLGLMSSSWSVGLSELCRIVIGNYLSLPPRSTQPGHPLWIGMTTEWKLVDLSRSDGLSGLRCPVSRRDFYQLFVVIWQDGRRHVCVVSMCVCVCVCGLLVTDPAGSHSTSDKRCLQQVWFQVSSCVCRCLSVAVFVDLELRCDNESTAVVNSLKHSTIVQLMAP